MPTHDDQQERQVRALRRLLNVEAPVPLGLRSRVEARVAAERRREPRTSAAVPSVLGLAGFIGASALYGLQVHSVTLLGVLGLGSVLYGLGVRRLVSVTDARDRTAPQGGTLPDEQR